MRRRVVEAPAYPEPPVHLRRCVVEDVLTPGELAQVRSAGLDVLAAAFLAQRDKLTAWAQENDVPWQETSKYRSAPRFRAQVRSRGGRR